MKKQGLFGLFLILLGIFIFLFLFSFRAEAKELTQGEIEEYVKLSEDDGRNILRSLPQVLTNEWIDSVVSVSSAEEEGVVIMMRRAIRGKIMDYFLREGPKEVGKELLKIGFKIGRLAIASDISAFLEEFEKMTVQESLKYLDQWLQENEIKTAFGNLDFSYDTLTGKKEKHKFQYIIIYSPETEETVIKIYSASPMAPPAWPGRKNHLGTIATHQATSGQNCWSDPIRTVVGCEKNYFADTLQKTLHRSSEVTRRTLILLLVTEDR